jgi:chromate transporter
LTGSPGGAPPPRGRQERVSLATIARRWTHLGCVGFGGPPTHIALLRKLCVEEEGWLSQHEFEDGIAATNLLPGPASTQLAIFCAWRLRAVAGGIVGGACFILPGLVAILALAVVFTASHPPLAIRGAAAGAGAAVPAVALGAAAALVPSSWRRAAGRRPERARWVGYVAVSAVSAATVGPYLVVVLLGCGLTEVVVRHRRRTPPPPLPAVGPVALLAVTGAVGGIGSLVWVALKVGALSFGGGFVIVPLMQADAVSHYHWMTNTQFLNAVALGQVTPGPVVQTVAVVGYAARGLAGGALAALVAFAPSFAFVLCGAPHFDRLRADPRAQAFLSGAGPAAIGAIAGSSIPLGLALSHLWQLGVLGAATLWLLGLRRGVVLALVGAGVLGVAAALVGAPVGG